MHSTEHPTESLRERDGVNAATFRRLQLCFATLCCLGGLVIAGNDDTQILPLIAIFFAVFGFVFVDWLELFALPPLLAYIAMACVAIYCVGGFWNLEAPGNQQMVSVANLLVMVQAILMLQRKTPRIFEQLTVFCLLQLVVAAVFNHAIHYGLLLIPICLLAATGLAMLSAMSFDDDASESSTKPLFSRPTSPLASIVSTSADQSFRDAARSANRLPRAVIITVVPATTLIGAMFFYALPRTTDAARPRNGGAALVGFNDTLHLDQIGKMQQSGQMAMRVRLRDRNSDKPYVTRQGFYLRGRVLDTYNNLIPESGGSEATWTGSRGGSISSSVRLPPEFVPSKRGDRNFYDAVEVEVNCESLRSPTLFAIAPYFRHETDSEIEHHVGKWTIGRAGDDNRVYPRINYTFLTHGFRNGVQSNYLAEFAPRDRVMIQEDSSPELSLSDSPNAEDSSDPKTTGDLSARLLAIDRNALPTAVAMGKRIASQIPEERRNALRVGRRIESFLSTSNQFSYTLNLDHPVRRGVDPIEQFLSIDRSGHCQYFASAMVMMLRSQGVPARIVVGYRTDDYNDLGQYYVVRQSHAHAWVEALISRDNLGATVGVYGQPRTDNYWVRFDPTPSFSLSSTSESGVSQVFDLAQNIWDDYVVDMDSKNQTNVLKSGSGDDSMTASYTSLFRWIESKIYAIRSGQLGGGSLAGGAGFSWTAAIATIVIGFVIFFVSKLPTKDWIRTKVLHQSSTESRRPRYAFYRETLRQLGRLGINMSESQTPAEVVAVASTFDRDSESGDLTKPLRALTDIYYRLRYRDPTTKQHHPRSRPLPIGDPLRTEVNGALEKLTERIDELSEQHQSS